MDAGSVALVCPHCDEPIRMGDDLARHLIGSDQGPRLWHEECSLRAIIGGLNHLKKLCTCCGGTLPPDPPELSKRDAARAAYKYMQEHGWPRH